MSRDARVDDYIAKAEPFARPILETIRARVHAAAPDIAEAIKWGMPAFTLGGRLVVGMAAFKAHAALNFWRPEELGLAKPGEGMGQFGKLTTVEQLPANLEELVRRAADLAAKR